MSNVKRSKNKTNAAEDALAKVPEPGAKLNRWYDAPYIVTKWMLRGWRRKITPKSLRSVLVNLLNALHQYNEYDRLKVWSTDDSLRNMKVDSDEHISVPSIIAVELYTANQAKNLEESIRKNGWDSYSIAVHEGDTNLNRLSKARAEQGASWWRLADVKNKNSKRYTPSSKTGDMPREFDFVSLRAMQIGSGLTIVLYTFHLNEGASMELDEVWHGKHEPEIKRVAGRLMVQDRLFAGYENTQSKREAIHDKARAWVSSYCPGFFSDHNEQHVSMDIMMTEKFNPTSKNKKIPDRHVVSAFRALGLNINDIQRIILPDMPDLILQRTDRFVRQNINYRRTWSLIGKRSELAKNEDQLKYYSNVEHMVIYSAENSLSYTLSLLATQEMLSVIEKHFSSLRDEAQLNHSSFKVKNLNKLNDTFMGASFTLASLKQDIKTYMFNSKWYDTDNIKIVASPHHKKDLPDRYANSEDYTELVISKLKEQYERLLSQDSDIRDILSTVASLGSSARSIVLARISLLVALLSLIVAITSLVSVSDNVGLITQDHIANPSSLDE